MVDGGRWEAPEGDGPPSVTAGPPAPRLIRSPSDAEEAAAEWVRWLGFTDAEVTGRGADGGVDVRGRAIVGQVKAHMVPVSRPDLQRLYGIAQAEKRLALFFSLMSYTEQAVAWADEVGMALFRFNHAGEVEPVNSAAGILFERAELDPAGTGQETEPEPAGGAQRIPELIWAYPVVCGDEHAVAVLNPRSRGSLRQTDTVEWITQGWLPVAGIRIDYTYLTRDRRPVERFGSLKRAFDLRHVEPVEVPPASGRLPQYPREWVTVPPLWSAEGIVEFIAERWAHLLGLVQPAAQQRVLRELGRFGVPSGVGNLRAHVEGVFLLPFYASLVSGPTGNRFAVVEGSTGQPHPGLAALFTHHAPDLYPYLATARRII